MPAFIYLKSCSTSCILSQHCLRTCATKMTQKSRIPLANYSKGLLGTLAAFIESVSSGRVLKFLHFTDEKQSKEETSN